MPESHSLLDQFLAQDADADLRAKLIERIAALDSEPQRETLDFTFNRFNLHIDCRQRRVVLEDDLDVSSAGTFELNLDEFVNALK